MKRNSARQVIQINGADVSHFTHDILLMKDDISYDDLFLYHKTLKDYILESEENPFISTKYLPVFQQMEKFIAHLLHYHIGPTM